MKTINDFINFASNNSKTALIFKDKIKWVRKSFSDFYLDIKKMNSLLKSESKTDNIMIFSYPYTYDFYVTAFSVILSGKNLVIIDSFKDKKKLSSMINSASVNTIVCDDLTRFFTCIFPKDIKRVNAKEYRKCNPIEESSNDGKVITFTSGTTGNPKKIERDITFLFNQINLVQSNINYDKTELVYGLLPMYSLMSLFLGNSTIICKNPNKVRKFNPTALITSIKAIQKINKPMKSVEKVFIGGAILYSRESKKIQNYLPNAEITYIYGASESAMIYKTTISKYIKETFCFSNPIDGVEVYISNPDKNKIGEICISGDTVIGINHNHKTGDLGRIIDGKLQIVGRKKYSIEGFYNYLIDDEVLNSNKKIKEAFSFANNNKKYVVYRGKLENKIDGVIYKKVLRIPHDLKHKTKADYSKLLEIVEN